VVLATVHAHEAREALERPARFLEQYARAAIDAGVDLFIPYRHEERFWWSVVPKVTVAKGWGWHGGGDGDAPEIVDVELHPITLGFGEPSWRRGTPERASGEKAEEILGELARLSEPFGTEIEIRDGVGRIRGF